MWSGSLFQWRAARREKGKSSGDVTEHRGPWGQEGTSKEGRDERAVGEGGSCVWRELWMKEGDYLI